MPDTVRPPHTQRPEHPPIAIGGVGGSGTRVIAALLRRLGYYMGRDFNKANDNLAFTLLFKRRELWPLEDHREEIDRCIRLYVDSVYFRRAPDPDDALYIRSLADSARLNAPRDWLAQRVEQLLAVEADGPAPARWGWKEPNTHIFLPALQRAIPGLRYIHVMRHGLDMAYSVNQAQLKFWGEALLAASPDSVDPAASFRYWCAAHRRVTALGERMGENFLLLNFDEFCADPRAGLKRLLDFLQVGDIHGDETELLDTIRRPASVGRHRDEPAIEASARDLELLGELGFEH